MPKQVSVTEARAHLSRLLNEVAQGEEIIIRKASKPIARLVPYQPRREGREPGALEGQIRMADDWDSDEVNKEMKTCFTRARLNLLLDTPRGVVVATNDPYLQREHVVPM